MAIIDHRVLMNTKTEDMMMKQQRKGVWKRLQHRPMKLISIHLSIQKETHLDDNARDHQTHQTMTKQHKKETYERDLS